MKHLVFILFFLVFPKIGPAQGVTADARNFYGICWRGTPHDNLKYAKQMGYDYVFYQPGMENDPLSAGLYFYIESPEYMIYPRTITIGKHYSQKQIAFYGAFCVNLNSVKNFPDNMARGWAFNDSTFSVQLDFSKPEVVRWAVDSIMKVVDRIEAKNPNFHFGGFAWDVPQLSGDFWSPKTNVAKPKQVTLSYWNYTTKKYEAGHYTFYKNLFSKARERYSAASFIIEPSKIYEDWLKDIEPINGGKLIMPNIICQEARGYEFLEDERVKGSALMEGVTTMSTCPSYFSEEEYRKIVSATAVQGSWFSWFGRFGGTGNVPNYKNITDVPPRLKLIRMITIWENLNKTSLGSRNWDGSVYSSPTAYISSDIIAARKPNSNKLFVVFLNKKAAYKLPKRASVSSAYLTDGFFIEQESIIDALQISGGIVRPTGDITGKGIILQLKD